MKTRQLLIALPLLGLSFTAFGQSTIGGDVDLNVKTENVINAAIGKDTEANTSIGAIRSSDVQGDVDINVEAKNVINAAIGKDAPRQIHRNNKVLGRLSDINSVYTQQFVQMPAGSAFQTQSYTDVLYRKARSQVFLVR